MTARYSSILDSEDFFSKAIPDRAGLEIVDDEEEWVIQSICFPVKPACITVHTQYQWVFSKVTFIFRTSW